MAVCQPQDESHDKVTEQVWGLCSSASRGDVHKLKSYMHQEGITVNIRDQVWAGALMMATEQSNVMAIKTLLAAGVDVNMSHCEQKTQVPLMVAAEKGYVMCLIALIDGGARINEVRDDGQTSLAIAILEGCSDDVKNVIDAKTRVKIRPFMGSVMMTRNTSWKEQHEECAVLLMQAGADIGYTNDSGYSLLMSSAANGSIKTVKSLIQAGANINQIAKDGSTALHLACRCTSLLDYRLYMECVSVLLKAGASADAVNLDGNTAIMLAVINSSQYKKKFRRTEIIQLLLQAGANLNVQDKNGKTALMYAAERNLTSICEFLMKHSADISIQDNNGKTAYMYVTDHQCLQTLLPDVVLPLLSADVSIRDSDGRTVKMYYTGCRGPKTLFPKVILYEDSVDISIQGSNRKTANTYLTDDTEEEIPPEAIVPSNLNSSMCYAGRHSRLAVNLNIQDTEGRTALMHAAMRNLPFCCELLVSHFCDVNMQDNEGRTAILYATDTDCMLSLLTGRLNCNLIHYEMKLKPNITDRTGKTALMHVAEHNLDHICFRLLRIFMAAADIQDNQGKTALMYASKSEALSEILSQWRADPNIVDNSGDSVLVHLLKRQKSYSDLVRAVTVVLKHGANPVLDPCYYHLLHLKSHSTSTEFLMETLAAEGQWEVVRLLVCNGFVTHMGLQESTCASYPSPLCRALKAHCIDLAKYLIACCYLSESDLRGIHALASTVTQVQGPGFSTRVNKISDEVRLFVQQVVSQPWPLVKLAFIAVSSAFGSYPKRNENIAQSQLPARLQRMLMFQEPITRLPVSEWSKIQLCFDPSEFEKMPRPRPLLYYWPVGRDMVI